MLREVEKTVTTRNLHDIGTTDYYDWFKKGKTARALVVLSISDGVLKQTRDLISAKEMWESILNIFQNHALLNNLKDRRDFYAVTMNSGEDILSYISQVGHLASLLKSMGVNVDSSEIAMAALNGLTRTYDDMISAMDAFGEDYLTLYVVKGRLLKEERRNSSKRSWISNESALL